MLDILDIIVGAVSDWFYMVLMVFLLMQNGKQMVQEGALTALASVADSSQVSNII